MICLSNLTTYAERKAALLQTMEAAQDPQHLVNFRLWLDGYLTVERNRGHIEHDEWQQLLDDLDEFAGYWMDLWRAALDADDDDD